MGPISKAFVQKLEAFATQHGISVVPIRKAERKDEVAAGYLNSFKADEGACSSARRKRR